MIEQSKETLSSSSRSDIVAQIAVAVLASVALVALVVAPFNAWRWAAQPFPGVFFESTLNVTDANNPAWEGPRSGLTFPDHLVQIDDTPIHSRAELDAALFQRGIGARITLHVVASSGQQKSVPVTLIQFPRADFISFFVVPYIVGLVYLAAGIWVFVARRRQSAGRAFTLMCVGLASGCTLLFDIYTTHTFAWLWSGAIPLAAGGAISLALLFPQEQSFVTRWPALRWIPFLLSFVLTVAGWATVYNFNAPSLYAQVWKLSYAYSVLGIVILLGMTAYRRWSSPSPIVRQQSRIILWGGAAAFIPIGVWLVVFLINPATQVLSAVIFLPLIFFPLALAYAIVRYQVLDVDVVLGRTMTYVLVTAAVGAVYLAMVGAVHQWLHWTVPANDPWVIMLLVFGLAIFLEPARARVQLAVDRVFYRTQVDYREALENFRAQLTGVVDLDTVLAMLYDQVTQSVDAEPVWVFLRDARTADYVAHATPGGERPAPGTARFREDSPLVAMLAEIRGPLYILTGRPLPRALVPERARLSALGTPLFIPLNGHGRIEGWLALGPKVSGSLFNSQDLHFLSALADATLLALDKARVFSDLDRRVKELSALSLISQAVNFTLPLDDIFELIYTQTSRILETNNFYVVLYR